MKFLLLHLFIILLIVRNSKCDLSNNRDVYYERNLMLKNGESDIEKTVETILKYVEELMSNLITLSIYNMTKERNNSMYNEDNKIIEEYKKCKESYEIFSNNKTEKAKRYYLHLLYYDSSKSKNDLGTYTDCTDSQTVSYNILGIDEKEKNKYKEDSTYMIIQIHEKKKNSFADIKYQENEYLVGLCLKKGCSENALKKTFYELNKEIKFFDYFDYDDIDVYDLDEKKISRKQYILNWIPFLILFIFILFSLFKFIPNIVFARMNPRKFNEIKECFNLKNNHEEIFGSYQDNENIVSNDSGLSIIKGLRGLNMIAVLISTSFFYIYHLPTKIYNKDTFKDFITSFGFSVVYYGSRFGVKILYAMSGFELVYKMLNYLDNCIENKEKLNINKDEQEEEEIFPFINDINDSKSKNFKKRDNKKKNNDAMSLKERKKEEEEEEDEEEDEYDTENIIDELAKDNDSINRINKKKLIKENNNKGNKGNKKLREENLFDLKKIDLSNEEEISKLENINKVLYKKHREKLEGKILFIFIIKQWHRFFMFILAIFFYKFGVIQPFLVFSNPSPMWLIYLRQIVKKFRIEHILSNIFCYSPFSFYTYNGIDPFGMVYNEIIFFLIGSSLIFICYKYCCRLDLYVIYLSILFFIIKLGIGIYFLFNIKEDDNFNKENYKKEIHGFYPLMFFQYNEDNLKIKSFLFSNQIFNIPFFLIGILFGEMNYCIQNFSKANDRNKMYLSIAKKALNCFSKMRQMKIIYFVICFCLFGLCVFTYLICINNTNVENPKDFFLNPIFNLIGLIDSDISVVFYFLCIILLLLSGDNIILNFLRHKYWGIFSRTYWTFLLCLHICSCFIFYLSENRIKLIFYNVIFFSFEMLMVVAIAVSIIFICVEIPLKKINKLFIKNSDEIILDYKIK